MPSRPPAAPAAPLLLGLAAGLAVFAASLSAALTFLPEWRAPAPAGRRAAADRAEEVARQGGFEPIGEPQLRLAARTSQQGEPYRSLGDDGSRRLLAAGTALVLETVQRVRDPAARLEGYLTLDLGEGLAPASVTWVADGVFTSLGLFDGEAQLRRVRSLAPLLVRPGETLGAQRHDSLPTVPRLAIALDGSSPPSYLYAMAGPPAFVARRPGTLTDRALERTDAIFGHALNQLWFFLPACLAVLALFAGLLAQRRLSAVNAVLLAALALPTLNPFAAANTFSPAFALLGSLLLLAWLAIVWSTSESLLRTSAPDFTTSLDALRTGRLGPRAGRALLLGTATGAALAGGRLALLALAETVPGLWSSNPSLTLPLSQTITSPVAGAVLNAGWIALALALAQRFVWIRWAPYAATLTAALLAPAVPLAPGLAGFAANLAFAGALVFTARRHGLTALLATTLALRLLPTAAFAYLHREWMPVAAWLLPAGLAALVVLGWLGLRRSAAAEVERLAPPAFVRRIEGERRLKHEMELLARMQKGLLPPSLPAIPGWEIAAKSILATEAGGDLYDVFEEKDGYVWIAVGDVAGHGYSCAIALAMAKAALTSLIAPGRRPAFVLERLDQVLRAAGADRNFTTLALLRLWPATGEADFANAGHPYPYLLGGGAKGEPEEIALPSLPLARGPARRYSEVHLRLEPGSTLVFFSDGLVEATDRAGEPYGFDRLRARVRKQRGRSAERMVTGLFGDWARHLRTLRAADDTSVLVLRRLEERS